MCIISGYLNWAPFSDLSDSAVHSFLFDHRSWIQEKPFWLGSSRIPDVIRDCEKYRFSSAVAGRFYRFKWCAFTSQREQFAANQIFLVNVSVISGFSQLKFCPCRNQNLQHCPCSCRCRVRLSAVQRISDQPPLSIRVIHPAQIISEQWCYVVPVSCSPSKPVTWEDVVDPEAWFAHGVPGRKVKF